MARLSANRRRRMNRSMATNLRPAFARGGLSGSGNWVVSDQGTDATGAPITVHGWANYATGKALASGVGNTLLLVALPTAAAATGQPTIGHVEVAQVHGKVQLNTFSAAGHVLIGVCMYIAELNSSATAWSIRDPLVESDANRDDYLFLDTWNGGVAANAGYTASTPIEFRLSLPRPVVIGSGQALAMTCSFIASGGALTAVGIYNLRSLVRRAS